MIKSKSGEIFDFDFHVFDLGLDARFPIEGEVFDTVICSEVIEHLTFDPNRGLLNEIWRVLKSDGVLVLSTPNLTSLDGILRACRNESPLIHPIFSENGWLEHPKQWSPLELGRKLEKANFHIQLLTTIVEPYDTTSSLNQLKGFLERQEYNLSLSKLFTLIVAKKNNIDLECAIDLCGGACKNCSWLS